MRSNLKGTSLEKAVEAIERVIVEAVPGYNKKNFRIERRKVVTVGGVKHEFDIWVEVDLGNGYRSVFIFECRNRSEKADKNDIIILSGKAAAVCAQSAFFVARAYTRDARSQAATDPRITLLLARDLPTKDLDDWLTTYNLEFEAINRKSVSITMVVASTAKREKSSISLQGVVATLGGNPLDLAAYNAAWLDAVCDGHTQKLGPDLPDGCYPAVLEDVRIYKPGEFVIDNECILKAKIRVELDVYRSSPHILSAFEVAGRGRALLLAPFTFPGGRMEMVSVDAQKGDDAG